MLRFLNLDGCYAFFFIVFLFCYDFKEYYDCFYDFRSDFLRYLKILAIFHKFAAIIMSETTIFEKEKKMLRFLTIKLRFLRKCTATLFFKNVGNYAVIYDINLV